MDIQEIHRYLRRGDVQTIAKISGVSVALVEAIFQERRSYDTPYGRKAVWVAKKIIETREEIRAEFEAEFLNQNS